MAIGRTTGLVMRVLAALPAAVALAAAATIGTGAAAPGPVPVDVTGATSIQYDAPTEQYVFIGPRVVLRRGDERLEAPEVRYDGSKRLAVLPRGGTLVSPTTGLTADTMTVDLGTRHLTAEGGVRGKFLDKGVWAMITADSLSADDRAGLRQVTAEGDAVIVRGDQELRGAKVVYDRTTQRGAVDGRAVAVRGGDRIEADHIDGDLAKRDGEAAGHVVFARPAKHMRGTADRATYSDGAGTVVLIGHAVITRNRDRLDAARITVRLRDNVAIADGGTKIVAYPHNASP